MSDISSFGHGEFADRIAAYLAGGLEGAELTAFEGHRESCAKCAAELAKVEQADRMLEGMFAGARPGAGFEDRIVQELRVNRPPMRLSLRAPHPMILKVASGVAAAILVASVGYVGNRLIENNQLPGMAPARSNVVVKNNRGQGGPGIGLGGRGQEAMPFQVREERGWYYRGDSDGDASGKHRQAGGEPADGKDFSWGRGRGSDIQKNAEKAQNAPEGQVAEKMLGATVDGTAATEAAPMRVLNGEVDALSQAKPDTAAPGQGVPASGGDGSGGGGLGYGNVNGGAINLGIANRTDGAEVNQPEAGFVAAGGVTAGAGATTYGMNFGGQKPDDFGTQTFYNDGHTSEVKAGTEALGDKVALAGKPVENRFFQPTNAWAVFGDQRDKLAEQVKDIQDVESKTGADSPAIPKPAGRPAETPAERDRRSGALGTVAQVTGGDAAQATNPQVQAQTNPQAQQQPAVTQRKIIRNGEMEFEVDSFDTSFLQISKIVTEERGFVSSTNSEKLPNGKVRGTVVVRVPPEHLDTLVLKLRALGDLKSQKISAQDVTKVYFDLESELKAARAMEERLLNIIKSGKGEIKDLLAAEKELGVYRNKIEKVEGEIRYYNNLVSFSTLAITAAERDIRKAAFASQTEQVSMGIENEDVEKARADAIKAIEDAKGRIIESNLKKFDGGQLAATITCEVTPDASGPLIDRLRQLGRVARLDIERKQTPVDGPVAAAPAGLRVEKKDTRFAISLYNLANIAPRQTTNMNVAVPSVEEAYRAIIDAVRAKNGRIVTSSLNRQKPEQTTATISFEVPSGDADATLAEIRRDREVMMLTVTENPDTNNVTAAKRGFSLQIFSIATVAPRETESLIIASRARVQETFRNVLNELRKADARILQSQLNEQDKNNIGGILDFEVARTKEVDVRQALGAAGDLVSRTVNRSSDTDQRVDSKIRLQVRLMSFDRLTPRETQSIQVASRDVAGAYQALAAAVAEVSGRVIRSELNVAEQNNVNGVLDFEIRREDREKVQKALEAAGTMFSRAVTRAADNVNTVESKIRLQVNLTDIDQLPPRERTKMVVEVGDVEGATAKLLSAISTAGGRVIDTQQSKDPDGQVRSQVVAEVPLAKASDVRGQIRALGKDRVNESATNHQAPQGEVARARFEVTLANEDLIVGRDEGLWAAVRSALSTSVRGLLWSLQFIVIGLLMVGPWVLLIWGGWKLWKRSKRTPAVAPA